MIKKLFILICIILLCGCQKTDVNTIDKYNDEIYNTAFSKNKDNYIYFTAGCSLYRTDKKIAKEIFNFYTNKELYPTGYCLTYKDKLFCILAKTKNGKMSYEYVLASLDHDGKNFKILEDIPAQGLQVFSMNIQNNKLHTKTGTGYYTCQINDDYSVSSLEKSNETDLIELQEKYIEQTYSYQDYTVNSRFSHIYNDYHFETNFNTLYQRNLKTDDIKEYDIKEYNTSNEAFSLDWNLIDGQWFGTTKEGIVMTDLDLTNKTVLLKYSQTKQLDLNIPVSSQWKKAQD